MTRPRSPPRRSARRPGWTASGAASRGAHPGRAGSSGRGRPAAGRVAELRPGGTAHTRLALAVAAGVRIRVHVQRRSAGGPGSAPPPPCSTGRNAPSCRTRRPRRARSEVAAAQRQVVADRLGRNDDLEPGRRGRSRRCAACGAPAGVAGSRREPAAPTQEPRTGRPPGRSRGATPASPRSAPGAAARWRAAARRSRGGVLQEGLRVGEHRRRRTQRSATPAISTTAATRTRSVSSSRTFGSAPSVTSPLSTSDPSSSCASAELGRPCGGAADAAPELRARVDQRAGSRSRGRAPAAGASSSTSLNWAPRPAKAVPSSSVKVWIA